MADDPRLILVVEDEPAAAILQRRRLERAGFSVATACDVEGAMQALASDRVDLVVMDYRLGTTTGLDLNRRLKAAGFDIPVILVSGSIDDATIIEAMRAGVKDVVVKNLDYLDYLPDAVRGVLTQTAAVSERQAPGRQSASVLIVEGDPGVAALEQRQLARAGYDVSIAGNAEDALEEVRQGRVHLAVLDHRLGCQASGLELYEQIRAEGWNVPAILVTAHADQAVAIRALRTGVRDIVPKTPDYLEHLAPAVDRVIAQARVERKLVESELRLASVIGTTLDAIVMCDERLRIVLFNRAAEELFGRTAAEALSRTLPAFIPGLDLSDVRPDQVGAARQRVEVEAVHAGGRRIPIEVSVSDVIVHGSRLFTVIARDVSERKRAEMELRDADRRKDVFLGMLAHELRNPLAAITTAGEVLHRTVGQPAAQKLTTVIRRQTVALGRMVDDLLDVSRVTLGKIQVTREPLLLGEVVMRAGEAVKDAAAAAGLELKVEIDPQPVWLTGDATRLEQVVANLLQNAIKFTRPGGRVVLRAGLEGDAALIGVRDTGIGIDPALLPRIFELFVQGDTSLDRTNSGLGIGLALVRQVVLLHGGRVTAHSEGLGAGAEFVVRLPALPDEVAAPAASAESAGPPARGMRVLVVDDQEDLADCIALLIETLGHQAQAIYGGGEALAAARADVPDLMFVDIGMPVMTGFDFARAVRRDPALSGVRLVALTGYGRDEDRARVLQAGFDLHLTKPVSDTTLRQVLETFDPARTKNA